MAKEAKSKPRILQTRFTTDEIILAKVIRRLPELPDFNKMLVWVKVEDQVVILGGMATATFKKAAGDAARSIASVLRVDNGISANVGLRSHICYCPKDHIPRICDDGVDSDECCSRTGKPIHTGKKY